MSRVRCAGRACGALLVGLWVAGCAAAPRVHRAYDGAPRGRGEVAVIAQPYTRWTLPGELVTVQRVDGVEVSCRRDPPCHIELLPGAHAVEVTYGGTPDLAQLLAVSTAPLCVELVAVAGETYEVRAARLPNADGQAIDYERPGRWTAQVVERDAARVVSPAAPPGALRWVLDLLGESSPPLPPAVPSRHCPR